MKKLPMSRARLFPLLAASFILLFSCVFDAPRAEQPQVESPTPLSERLSIDDARVFFAEPGENLIFGEKGATRAGENPLSGFEPDWSEAVYSILLDEEVIEVPFNDLALNIIYRETDETNETDEETENFPELPNQTETNNTCIKLIAGLDKYGEITYRLLYITSFGGWAQERELEITEVTLADTNDAFTGSFILHTVEGEFIAGYIYTAGERTHTISYGTRSDDEQGTRSLGGETNGECVYRITDWWWCFYYPGTTIIDFTRCTYLGYTVNSMICLSDDNNEGNGGGNGGGGKPDPMERCMKCGKYPCVCCGVCEKPCVCPNKKCHKEPCECCTICEEYPCKCKEPVDPCEKMRARLSDPKYKAMLHEVQAWSQPGNGTEFGYKFRIGANGEYIFSPPVYGSGSNQTIEFEIVGGIRWDGYIHSHFPECGNMFSFADLSMIWNVISRGGGPKSFTYGLTTQHGIYFLTISDLSAYERWIMSFYNSTPGNPKGSTEMDLEKARKMNDIFTKNYSLGVDTPYDEAEMNFLRYLIENDTGLSMMKYDSQYDRFDILRYDSELKQLFKDICPGY